MYKVWFTWSWHRTLPVALAISFDNTSLDWSFNSLCVKYKRWVSKNAGNSDVDIVIWGVIDNHVCASWLLWKSYCFENFWDARASVRHRWLRPWLHTSYVNLAPLNQSLRKENVLTSFRLRRNSGIAGLDYQLRHQPFHVTPHIDAQVTSPHY